MSAWAKPGVKCVCIDMRNLTAEMFAHVIPVKGVVYTINDIHPGGFVGLAEVSQAIFFPTEFFRPLAYPSQSLEADLAKFKQVGRHVRAPEKERA